MDNYAHARRSKVAWTEGEVTASPGRKFVHRETPTRCSQQLDVCRQNVHDGFKCSWA